MHISAPFKATFQGEEVRLHVIRNNGYCWGRIVMRDGKELDVYTRRDHYDDEDEYAADAFERAAKRGKVEQPTSSWRIGWTDLDD